MILTIKNKKTLTAVFFFFLCSPLYASPDHRYFQSSDGIRLHYMEAGKGHTIIFIPGWTMPARIWLPQIRHFSKKYHAVAFDPRSQGDSDVARSGHTPERRAQDIKELLEQFKDDSFVLVGWSLGVNEALAYIKLFGEEKLKAVALVDNAVIDNPTPQASQFLQQFRENRNMAAYWFVRSMFRTKQDSAYLNELTQASLKTPLEAAFDLLTKIYPGSVWQSVIRKTNLPILYAATTRYRSQAEILKTLKPASRIEIFENSGHALFIDEPDRFNGLLQEFLTEAVWKAE